MTLPPWLARLRGRLAPAQDDADAPIALHLPAGARCLPDIAYGQHPAQRYDAYLPAGERARAAVVFYVHGGGWRRGDKAQPRMLQHKLDHWLQRGHVVVTVNYRLLPEADPLLQADDVACALAHAQSAAAQWGADATRFALVGHSAGAHLVLLLSSDPEITRARGAAAWRASVVLDSAAFDVVTLMRAPHLPLHDQAFGDDPAYWRQVSPLHRLRGRLLAPLLVVGSARRPLAWRQAELFADRVRTGGQQVSLQPLDLGHAEINRDLGLPGALTQTVDTFLAEQGLA